MHSNCTIFTGTEGFVYNELSKESKNGNYVLTVTDGKFKIDLRLKNFKAENVEYKICTKVKILGEILVNEGIRVKMYTYLYTFV